VLASADQRAEQPAIAQQVHVADVLLADVDSRQLLLPSGGVVVAAVVGGCGFGAGTQPGQAGLAGGGAVYGSKSKPNLVAITTWSRTGPSACPTSCSLVNGP